MVWAGYVVRVGIDWGGLGGVLGSAGGDGKCGMESGVRKKERRCIVDSGPEPGKLCIEKETKTLQKSF